MTFKKRLLAVATVAAVSLGASLPALAHGSGGRDDDDGPCGWRHGWTMMGPGMMGPGYGMGPGMMGPGYGMGPGMMGPGMMGPGYYMGPGMMGPGYGMAPGAGMGRGMGPGMMGPGYGMAPEAGTGRGMGPGYGTGQGMGPGYGTGQGMGPGYGMGRGMGPGYGMGQGMMQALPEDLSTDDVAHMISHQLAWNGNPNLKVGKVEEKDEDTITAEIVTQDGSLVQKLDVDRHTGWMRPAR